MQPPRSKSQEKKHMRANSSINNYATHQLQQQLQHQHQLATLQMGNFVPLPAGVNQVLNPKQPAGMQVSSKVARDSLNITNSLIISNSQILFQDMGNGKIVPVPMQFNQLNHMGTI